ncbi:tyrosine-type recombinase/integrase [Eisenbergiella tayi]|uniref:tyrosine-type recombinase/integrase n=1 Tax=Eisenbergiella tayi TaxID=1432052 RepID=UPI0008486D79|nr:tyrosine-type recombinase/integrase [Eisenbergiella tayi]ODR36268.1 hypothetical protein BEI60_13550 [Eisenbergiella tayi]
MPKKTLGAGFRKREDGRYESRFVVKGKRYSVYADTLAECKEKDAQLREKIRKGLYIDNQNITFDQYYKEWKAARKGTVKGNTALNAESRYKNHIGPALGKRKVVEMEKREIVKLQKDLAKKQKPSTVNATIAQVKSMLNSAVADGILTKSPAAAVKPLKDEGEKASETYHRALTVEEQTLFAELLRPEWYYELILFMLCTGVRVGEAASITWKDVDYINNMIHISTTQSRTEEGKYTVGSPKSRTSDRDIPMNEAIKEVLKSQKNKLKMVHGNVVQINQNVFESFTGKRVYDATVNSAIKRTIGRMKENGLETEHFTAHALRDTFATRYIEQGGSPQVLKTILGHSSLAMTMDLYSHVLPNTKQQEMDNIKIAF